jgi:hypothetical protein
MPKIVDLVVNGMVNRPYSIKPSNWSGFAENKQAYRKRIESDQNTPLPIIKKAKEDFEWILSMPIDELPMTKEELNIHMQMEWSQLPISNH